MNSNVKNVVLIIFVTLSIILINSALVNFLFILGFHTLGVRGYSNQKCKKSFFFNNTYFLVLNKSIKNKRKVKNTFPL